MLGVQFQKVGGGALSINEAFKEPAIGTFVGTTTDTSSDRLQVWNPQTQNYASYWFGDWADSEDYNRKWYPLGSDEYATENVVEPGVGIWFISKNVNSANALIVGEVISTNITIKFKAGGLTAWSNPFPVPLSLSDVSDGGTIDWVNSDLTGAASDSASDRLLIWNPLTQNYATYWFGDWDDDEDYNRKWYPLGSDEFATTDIIPVGGSAWLNLAASENDVVITLVAPDLN